MKRHALFVGVDQYADGHIPNLSCAVNDATDLHGFFKYGAGYDQVELLPNPSSKKEVLGKVRSLTAGLGLGDFFLFFFAGHGFRVGENHVLVCSNDLYDDVKYEDDGLPLGQLKRRLFGAFDTALLLDACQSDILATRGGEGIAERDLSLIHEAPTGGSGCGALTIVTSCDAGQTAAELFERRHGLFTVAMLDLLKEAQRARSRLDLSDAFRLSLGQRMGEIAARFGLPTEQRPRFSSTGDTCFVLLEGSAASQPIRPQATIPTDTTAPVLVVCPSCGFRNREEQTFRCKVCGRDYLCRRHYDEAGNCCADCATKQKEEREHKFCEETEENTLRETHKKVQLWKNGPYWAETNIGAENPWEPGYYNWWGDTVGYKYENGAWMASDGTSSRFSFDNIPTCDKSNSNLQREGWITADGLLMPTHDAAHVKWGGEWRMPTDQELTDLCEKCDWAWTTMNGMKGYVVRGIGDYSSASIFLPAAGFGLGTSLLDAGSDGHYWSSVSTTSDFGRYADGLSFDSSYGSTDDDGPDCGRSVRPVQGFTK